MCPFNEVGRLSEHLSPRIVAGLVREYQIEDDREANLLETGVRWQATPLTVVSAGVDNPQRIPASSQAGFDPAMTRFAAVDRA